MLRNEKKPLKNIIFLVSFYFSAHHYRWMPRVFAIVLLLCLSSFLDLSIDYLYTVKCEGEQFSPVTENPPVTEDPSIKVDQKNPSPPEAKKPWWYNSYVFWGLTCLTIVGASAVYCAWPYYTVGHEEMLDFIENLDKKYFYRDYIRRNRTSIFARLFFSGKDI